MDLECFISIFIPGHYFFEAVDGRSAVELRSGSECIRI